MISLTQRPVSDNTQHSQEAGFEPSIPTSDRTLTHALERAVTGIEGYFSLPDANRTLISRRPVLNVVTILTELTQLAQQDEEFYNFKLMVPCIVIQC